MPVTGILPSEKAVVGEALSAHPVTIVSEPNSQTNGPLKELPEHLNSLFQKSVTDLDQSQRTLLMDLLEEYQDDFVQNEFDLGSFTDIEHSIDTGSAPPIKQRMRRTPLDFVQEEETICKPCWRQESLNRQTQSGRQRPYLFEKKTVKSDGV